MIDTPFSELQLEGTMLTDPAATAYAGGDFGGIVRNPPIAVAQIGSTTDIGKVLQAATTHGVPAVPRGCGHTSLGQAQIRDGVVIDVAGLNTIHEINDNHVVVDAGTTWSTLLSATLERGLTPPVLTDYLDVSVGGTLSVGGIGGTSHRYGTQTDNVISLEVFTGDGKLRSCSLSDSLDLFHSTLAGFGRCGVITRAAIPLILAPERVRRYKIYHSSADNLIAQQRKLLIDGRFDFLQGEILPSEIGWQYMLDVAAYYTPPRDPSDSILLQELDYQPGRDRTEDLTYWEFATRLNDTVTYLETTGEWHMPHPWPNILLPNAATDLFVDGIMNGLTRDDLGASGLILIYPLPSAVLRTPLFRAPDAEVIFLIAGLRFANSSIATADMVNSNRDWYDTASKLGGTAYPTGAIPWTEADWKHHLGTTYPRLVQARAQYDPHGLFRLHPVQ